MKRMSQDVALPSTYETGLEDFNPAEAGLPRIHIKHSDGVFEDRATNEQFPVMRGVFLGMIKQRVMWAKTIEDDSKPLCKSNNSEVGYPNVNGPRHSLFPWSKSGMTLESVPRDEDGRPIIKCETCPFAEWTVEDGDKKPPLCSERYTMPVHFSTEEDGPLDHAGIISFQRSSLTPLKHFMAAFSRLKMPLFSAMFRMELNTNKRGQVIYSVPKVMRGPSTNQDDWSEFAEEYRGVRDMLRRPPMVTEADAATPAASGNAWNPAAGSGVVEGTVVGEPDPWATTDQVTPQQNWPQSAPAAKPVSQPLVGTGLVNAASTPVVPAAQPVSTVSAANDDDLPF